MRRQSERDDPLRLAFRSTALGKRQLGRIQALVAAGSGRSRQELARDTARAFRWRRPNGALAIRGARELLIRLEAAGVVRLPAPRRAQGRPRRDALEEQVRRLSAAGTPAQPQGEQSSGTSLLLRPVRSEELLSWRAHMERFHYLGDAPMVGESMRYVAEVGGEWVALIGWAAAALKNGPRDRFVGWDAVARAAKLACVVGNARFLVLPAGGRYPHLASRVLAANLRRLSRDWQQLYGHRVVLAETFVDTGRFRGTCYRAANWIYVGETKGWSKSGAHYRFNGQSKAVWLYPLARDFKEQLCTAKQHGAVSKDGRMLLDVEKLPLDGHGGLFELLCRFSDPRKRRGVRHKIQCVLATGICAVLAGARSITAMAEWAAEQPAETLRRLGSKRGKPPSERTYRRIFASIDTAELDRQTSGWVRQQLELQPGAGLAVDGKTVRGSRDGDRAARHLLSAVVHGAGEVVAQVSVESKTNEITRVEPLLDELDLRGIVVTADALHTQKKLAHYLVEHKGADYVFTAKDNQPTLREDIATLGLEAFPPAPHDARQGARPDREARDMDEH